MYVELISILDASDTTQIFFFLEHAGEMRIIILKVERDKVQNRPGYSHPYLVSAISNPVSSLQTTQGV
jgi:hypothetical protein